MNITAAHKARWSRFPAIGCLACRKEGLANPNTQVHHLNVGGKAGQKRRGHDFTIPLCPWHHQGHGFGPGPSLAKQSKAFRAAYGTDDELLAWTNELIRMGALKA
jgi:hypothetical protein